MNDLSLHDTVFGDTRLDVRGTNTEVILTAVDESGTMIVVRLNPRTALTLIGRLETIVGSIAAVGREARPNCSMCVKPATLAVTDGVTLAYTCPDHRTRVTNSVDPREVVTIGLTHD